MRYDAVILLSFGGPERREDVLPFLERVLHGRNVPRARIEEVASHYYHLGGCSPLNKQCQALAGALRQHVPVPVYWGNRNWHPLLGGVVRQMAADGVKRALAIATSAFSSYSGCRQYLEDIAAARAEAGPSAPVIDKLPPFWDHPKFTAANAGRLREALARIPEERRARARVLFSAHSIPLSMAANCRYEAEIREASRRVASACGCPEWELVWQSRSGQPTQPWLTPDLLTRLRELAAQGAPDVLCMPIGFLSDHMEVLYDLDVEAAALSRELGLGFFRAGTVGLHPELVELLSERVVECQTAEQAPACPDSCCPAPARR
jgi:protoporphyrin/coproporphyrin ferrochelatase